MEKLLVRYQISNCFFRVFKLFEFNEKQIVEWFEILLHIIDFKFTRDFKVYLLNFSIHEKLKIFHFLSNISYVVIIFVLIEFWFDKWHFKFFNMSIKIHPDDVAFLVCFLQIEDYLVLKHFLHALQLFDIGVKPHEFLF